MKSKIILIIIMLLYFNCIKAQGKDDLDLSKMIQPADSSFFVKDVEYYNWCNSVIKGEDGLYHLFFSRWPKKIGFYSWLTHSEIAHATAINPYGPYKNAKTILKSRSNNWDKITMHNVQVNKFGDKYYMYYISTNSDTVKLNDDDLQEIGSTGYSHRYWSLLRSNQRTGVAVATDLNGCWKRMDSCLIQPSKPIYTVAVNPSVCKGKDGRYYMIIKGDNSTSSNRHLIQAVGISDNPLGPFILEKEPAFSDIPTEDVCIWFDKERNRFYAIFHAHGGDFIGLITSENGINWKKANNYIVCKKEVPLNDGTVLKVDRMERPYIYLEDGKPKMLSFGVKKGNDAFIVFFNLCDN